MAVIYSPEDPKYLEEKKWDQPNYNPRDPRNQYPKMLYKAQLRPDGKPSVGEGSDVVFSNRPGAAELFSNSCQRIVRDPEEHERARAEGWRDDAKEALDYHEGLARAVADAAAYRHAEDAKMSEKAREEAAEADASTSQHLPTIPEKRLDGRSRAARAAKAAQKPSYIGG